MAGSQHWEFLLVLEMKGREIELTEAQSRSGEDSMGSAELRLEKAEHNYFFQKFEMTPCLGLFMMELA